MDSNSNKDSWPADPLSSSLETLPERGGEHLAQVGEYDPVVAHQLTLAKASRDQAETARQKITEEILEAAREKCQELIASGNSALQNARHLEAEAATKYSEAQGELRRAESIRAQAEADGNSAAQDAKCLETETATKYSEAQNELKRAEPIRAQAEADRERILVDAHWQAQELLDTARLESERERVDLKHQASVEAQRILAQTRAMRDAAREELEAQRIYADAAKLKAWSHDILGQLGTPLNAPPVIPEETTNGNSSSATAAQGPQDADQAESPGVDQVLPEEPPEQETPVESSDEKKPDGGANSGK